MGRCVCRGAPVGRYMGGWGASGALACCVGRQWGAPGHFPDIWQGCLILWGASGARNPPRKHETHAVRLVLDSVGSQWGASGAQLSHEIARNRTLSRGSFSGLAASFGPTLLILLQFHGFSRKSQICCQQTTFQIKNEIKKQLTEISLKLEIAMPNLLAFC